MLVALYVVSARPRIAFAPPPARTSPPCPCVLSARLKIPRVRSSRASPPSLDANLCSVRIFCLALLYSPTDSRKGEDVQPLRYHRDPQCYTDSIDIRRNLRNKRRSATTTVSILIWCGIVVLRVEESEVPCFCCCRVYWRIFSQSFALNVFVYLLVDLSSVCRARRVEIERRFVAIAPDGSSSFEVLLLLRFPHRTVIACWQSRMQLEVRPSMTDFVVSIWLNYERECLMYPWKQFRAVFFCFDLRTSGSTCVLNKMVHIAARVVSWDEAKSQSAYVWRALEGRVSLHRDRCLLRVSSSKTLRRTVP